VSGPLGEDCGCDCTQALEQLYLFLDSEIDTATCEEIQRHVDACGSCLDAYDLERLVRELVSRSCSERAPEPLRERVLLRIREVTIRAEFSGE